MDHGTRRGVPGQVHRDWQDPSPRYPASKASRGLRGCRSEHLHERRETSGSRGTAGAERRLRSARDFPGSSVVFAFISRCWNTPAGWVSTFCCFKLRIHFAEMGFRAAFQMLLRFWRNCCQKRYNFLWRNNYYAKPNNESFQELVCCWEETNFPRAAGKSYKNLFTSICCKKSRFVETWSAVEEDYLLQKPPFVFVEKIELHWNHLSSRTSSWWTTKASVVDVPGARYPCGNNFTTYVLLKLPPAHFEWKPVVATFFAVNNQAKMNFFELHSA